MSAEQLLFSDESSLDVAVTDGTNETTALLRGDLAAMTNRAADRSRVEIDIDPHLFDTHTGDRIRYRDCLWTIWAVAAPNKESNGVYLNGKEARQQPGNPFNQDFRAVDDTLRPTDEVAVGVLNRLLLPPTGVGFGLGVASGLIPRSSISVSLTCKPTEAIRSNRRTEVFARILTTYADQLARRQSEQGCAHVGSAPGGAPTRSASLPRDAYPRAKSPVRPHPSISEP